ncbi:MAG: flagellar basal body L-ring protein FlgH [Vitreimonas sp.]
MRLLLLAAFFAAPSTASADNLFHDQPWANVASDQRASHAGDIITVVVYQNAEARNGAQNTARRATSIDGAVRGGSTDETATLAFNGAYSGQGQVSRSESFITQISVTIESVMPNGDFAISGQQVMHVNGEDTLIRIRGRIRATDISGDNRVLSSRIADAQINYDGHGFVSRNARPGIVQRLFGLLGLSG